MNISMEKFSRPCVCGKEHKLQTKEIIIERGATAKLPEIVRLIASGHSAAGASGGVCFISDENTFAFARPASKEMKGLTHCIKPHIVLNPDNLHADEKSVKCVLTQLPADAGCLIAAGSGTIHDITRYVAAQRGIPFVAYPTAASVDGFVSDGCAMTWHGFKRTIPAIAPVAAVADTGIFAYAPYRLTASGVGDVLGKYISFADWRIASLVSDEIFCPVIAAISREAVDNVRENLTAIHAHDTDAMEKLMYALLLSGITMQMWRGSRPASGVEHLFSHFWEMEIANGPLGALHGEKVGVALNIVLSLYKNMANDSNFGKSFHPYNGMPHEEMKKVFGDLYDSVIEENTPDSLAGASASLFEANLDEIRRIIADLPDADELRADMDRAKVLTSLPQIGLDDSILRDTIKYAPYVRNRITLLRLATP